jgi:hypothetical protein
MLLHELNDVELLALVGLARWVVRADGVVSEAEGAALLQLAEQVGAARWTDTLRGPGAQLRRREEVEAAVVAVERQEAREAIYEALHALAATDEVVGREAQVLDWVMTAWDLGDLPPIAPSLG